MSESGEKKTPKYTKFVFGGFSGMISTVFVYPLDFVKNRMQISRMIGKAKEYQTPFHVVKDVIAKEGFYGMYGGLTASLMRQATYTSTRLGIYTTLFESFTGAPPGFVNKVILGMVSGSFAGFVGTPAEVALVRMTADGALPPAKKKNYKNVFDAISRIAKEEGVLTLWRGVIPTMGRGMIVNAAQLPTYSQAKQFLLSTEYFHPNFGCHFACAMISGLVTTFASMPVDIAKTRIQNMRTIDGKPEYSGAIDVVTKVIRNEGVFALWKGFTFHYARVGPHIILTFILLEKFNAVYNKYALGIEDNVEGL